MDQVVIGVLKSEESGRTKIEAEQKVTQARAEDETPGFQKRKCDPRLVRLGQIEAGLRGSRSGRPHAESHVTGVPFVDVKNLEETR